MNKKKQNLRINLTIEMHKYTLAAMLCLFGVTTGEAQTTITKLDTATMNAATDWTPNGVPNNLTIGKFDNTISSGNEGALTLGGNVTLAGLLFGNNLNGPVNISGANALTLDSTLVSGAACVD